MILIIISHPETDCFQNCMNDDFPRLNKWIKANKLMLYLDKTRQPEISNSKPISTGYSALRLTIRILSDQEIQATLLPVLPSAMLRPRHLSRLPTIPSPHPL
jgi:hypothetical protein